MDPTRTLVVLYLRTGTTGIVARAFRDELGCEIEAIRDRTSREGSLGLSARASTQSSIDPRRSAR